MKESKANLWDSQRGLKRCVRCITTNGTVKKNGYAVMGRGCAMEAAEKYPGLQKELGRLIAIHGNYPQWLPFGLFSFPVKHEWFGDANLGLISSSAKVLALVARSFPRLTFLLPRPGCGNGRLGWKQVKPLLKYLPDNVVVVSFPGSK